ncbi:hypothetical protein T492DRAFT_1001313 [Pavlovales sp. CCMP2436]|nr:hypothetical protein T492DRAFT_1001313 [Pavlovales sp. CCMP2436]|mmetsp:Transcript_9979/g.26301  ORF Transcript_9979/g.26301 Transcript_9979/m.26301 type:complete len:290 (-) Transcript_9979:256-1125(-)
MAGATRVPFPRTHGMPAVFMLLAALAVSLDALHNGVLPRPTRVATALSSLDARLATAYERAQLVPCPFFRRRFTDTVESGQQMAQWVRARHKSLPIDLLHGPLLAVDSKLGHLALGEIAAILYADFERAAYINGRLTRAVYDDECFFDGPDPDMPVRGVRKYCLAVGGLFDVPRSECRLLGAPVVDELAGTISCHWRLAGKLRLPWHPAFKPYLGYTTYRVDAQSGLIAEQIEAWSIHPFFAFLSVLLPDLADTLVPDAPDVRSIDEWAAAWVAAGAKLPTHFLKSSSV